MREIGESVLGFVFGVTFSIIAVIVTLIGVYFFIVIIQTEFSRWRIKKQLKKKSQE